MGHLPWCVFFLPAFACGSIDRAMFVQPSSGQDNPSDLCQCIVGDVENVLLDVLEGHLSDHHAVRGY